MRWMLQDGLQSVRAISDGTNVLSAQAYSPYGEPMYNDLPTEFGFTGEQIDSANDVVYLRARVMNPKLGVFGSLDPLEGQNQMVGSLNRYNWVRGNVVNLRDANGMCPSLNPLSPTPQPIPLAPNSKYATPSATPNAPVQVTYEEVPTPEGTDDETAYGEIETSEVAVSGLYGVGTALSGFVAKGVMLFRSGANVAATVFASALTGQPLDTYSLLSNSYWGGISWGWGAFSAAAMNYKNMETAAKLLVGGPLFFQTGAITALMQGGVDQAITGNEIPNINNVILGSAYANWASLTTVDPLAFVSTLGFNLAYQLWLNSQTSP